MSWKPSVSTAGVRTEIRTQNLAKTRPERYAEAHYVPFIRDPTPSNFLNV
jgi:hypothetical protein